jgi:hypothetical protein
MHRENQFLAHIEYDVLIMIFSCFLDGLGLPTARICTSGAHTLESAYDSKARAPFKGDKIIIPFGNMVMNCMGNGENFPALLLIVTCP